MLKSSFEETASTFTSNQSDIISIWNDIVSAHTEKNRFYHNMTHLEFIWNELSSVLSDVKPEILFATVFHDFVYDSSSKDNEVQSALVARKMLTKLNVAEPIIDKCCEIITATTHHTLHTDDLVNYFLDADIAILGQSWPKYELYSSCIRKEYAHYPNIVYASGRTNILKNFLKQTTLFNTKVFIDKYELKARENISKELASLSKWI